NSTVLSTELSKPFFPFSSSQIAVNSTSFLLVIGVRSAEGRGLFSFTQLPNYPFTQFRWDTAESRQSAVFYFSKSFQENHTPSGAAQLYRLLGSESIANLCPIMGTDPTLRKKQKRETCFTKGGNRSSRTLRSRTP
ncbi:MAG: hypothetical protein JWN42_1558, partial [Candidatus Angelobacter sp.]|nr:hypothetical protein [Candidatus Angelobacter sp.]